MTLSEETLKTVCANAYAYTKRTGGRAGHRGRTDRDSSGRTVYFHGEKGAQNPAYIRNPDVEMFLRLGGSTRAGASDYDCTGDGRCQGVHPPAGGSGTYLGRTYLQLITDCIPRIFTGADHVTHFSMQCRRSPIARRACLARRLTRSMSCPD